MADSCPGCGERRTAEALACDRCGLRVASDGPGDPGILGGADLYCLSGPPVRIVSGDGNDPELAAERPPSGSPVAPDRTSDDPAQRRREGRRRGALWLLVVMGVASAVAGAIQFAGGTRGPVLDPTEQALRDFLGPGGLGPPPEAVTDPDRALDRLRLADPAAFAKAEVQCAALPRIQGASIHELFESYLDRALAQSPDLAMGLGAHPHPHDATRVDPVAHIRSLLLHREAHRALTRWAEGRALEGHEAVDHAMFLGMLETQILWDGDPGSDALLWMSAWADPLVVLANLPCCPEPHRRDAALARLRLLPELLAQAQAQVEDPPAPLVAAVARSLRQVSDYLRDDYPVAWERRTEEEFVELRAACAEASAATSAAARHLEERVLPRAKGHAGIGAANFDLLLRRTYHIEEDAKAVYLAAYVAHSKSAVRLATVNADIWRSEIDWQVPLQRTDEEQLAALRDLVPAWIETFPDDPGVDVRGVPGPWSSPFAGGYYLGPGPLSPRTPGVILLDPPPPTSDAILANWWEANRRHALAHEGYPGHHLQALFAADACLLRRFVDDRLSGEGWATYSQDLLHEQGACVGGPADEHLHAGERASAARMTMVEVLLHTRAASHEQLLALLSDQTHEPATLADLGDLARSPGSQVVYFAGLRDLLHLRQIERDRLGREFDPRAFHEWVLRSGGVPPSLLREHRDR